MLFIFFSSIQLYELASGQLLCSFLFSFGLTAVTMDLGEHWLFVGGANGSIAQINLFTQVLDNGVTCTSHSTFISIAPRYKIGCMKLCIWPSPTNQIFYFSWLLYIHANVGVRINKIIWHSAV